MAKQLTVSEVIEKLGGIPSVAKRFGVGETAVMNWRAWNRFPERLRLEVYLACQDAGIPFEVPKPKRRRAA